MHKDTITVRGHRRADTRSGRAVCSFFGLRRGTPGFRSITTARSPSQAGLLK
jgi:hypothetical protein